MEVNIKLVRYNMGKIKESLDQMEHCFVLLSHDDLDSMPVSKKQLQDKLSSLNEEISQYLISLSEASGTLNT